MRKRDYNPLFQKRFNLRIAGLCFLRREQAARKRLEQTIQRNKEAIMIKGLDKLNKAMNHVFKVEITIRGKTRKVPETDMITAEYVLKAAKRKTGCVTWAHKGLCGNLVPGMTIPARNGLILDVIKAPVIKH